MGISLLGVGRVEGRIVGEVDKYCGYNEIKFYKKLEVYILIWGRRLS